MSPIGLNEPNASGQTFTRWRDGVQGSTLAAIVNVNGVQTHDLSSFFATVDFVKLASGVDDDSGVINQGFTNRIYSASYEVMQGVGNPAAPNLMKSQGCTPTSTVAANGTTSCIPQFAGRLQPYSLFIPRNASGDRIRLGHGPARRRGQLSAQSAGKRRALDRVR